MLQIEQNIEQNTKDVNKKFKPKAIEQMAR